MNDSIWSRMIFKRAMSEDVFCESSGRELVADYQNRHLFPRMFKNYLDEHKQHQALYPEFEADQARLRHYKRMMYVYGAIGGLFALTVWNPNFIRRRAWYMKKISFATWALIGYQYGRKFYQDELTFTLLKLHDYLPYEAKRALQDQDFRHFALLDVEELTKTRKVWDEKTGKALS